MKATPPILEALAVADDVFEKRYRRPEALCMSCPQGGEAAPEWERFEAIVRAHRADRLTLPVHALVPIELGHGSGVLHRDLRRLAWFLPAFLATSVREGESFVQTMMTLVRLLDEARGLLRAPEEAWRCFRDEEGAALTGFLVAAASGALSDPAGEEELAASVAVAHAAGLDLGPFAAAWLALAATDSHARHHLHALVACVLDPTAWGGAPLSPWPSGTALEKPLRAVLVREDVRAWLEAAFLACAVDDDAGRAEASALSRSEAAVASALGSCPVAT